jgi:hypothetical protein
MEGVNEVQGKREKTRPPYTVIDGSFLNMAFSSCKSAIQLARVGVAFLKSRISGRQQNLCHSLST